jgi:hypothetical protein
LSTSSVLSALSLLYHADGSAVAEFGMGPLWIPTIRRVCSMKRKTLCAWVAIGALAASSCSTTPETPMSPSSVAESVTFLNPDGSTIKAEKPSGLSPNGGVLNTRRPTLSFNNATGRFQTIGFAYELEIQNANGANVYERVIGEGGGTTQHTLDTELSFSDTFWWRVRARLGDQVGPWSDFAQFRTPDPPPPVTTPPPTTGGGLPFPVPAECGPFGTGNRFACAAAVASQSAEWNRCARGDGVGCHRFTRQVAFALSQSDPNWQMIQAAPGGHACNCSGCGPSDGTMFREDTVVYAGREVFDMIVGAGGPSPSLSWSGVGAPRNVDRPGNAPVCQ